MHCLNPESQKLFDAGMNLDWQNISSVNVLPVLTYLVAQAESCMQQKFSQPAMGWHETLDDVTDAEAKLMQFWSMVSHLRQVCFDESWRDVYPKALALMTRYTLSCAHDKQYFSVIEQLLSQCDDPHQLAALQMMHRDFLLAGIKCSPKQQQDLKNLKTRLTNLSESMAMNLLDATDAWQLCLPYRRQLRGLPDVVVAAAKQRAKRLNMDGWCLSIEDADYVAVMQTAAQRNVRKRIFQQYRSRAGVPDTRYDNGALMPEILSLRSSLAKQLGYDDYASYALVTRAAETKVQVNQLLDDLTRFAKPQAEQEWCQLTQYAHDHLNIRHIQPWDTSYVCAQYEADKLGVDAQAYRPYFPLNRVLDGLKTIVTSVLSISIEVVPCEAWHPLVQCWRITDKAHRIEALCYIDLFARPGKQGGAWMDECRARWQDGQGNLSQPVAFLTCNFTPPTKGEALLTHDDVLTIFHEFGHTLHHCLSQVNVLDVSGISGVAWDAVEVPSQLFEHWCWSPDSLALMSGHVETGEAIPQHMMAVLLKSRQFLSATALMRQVALSQFDWQLHASAEAFQVDDIYQIYLSVMRQYTYTPLWDNDRMPASFMHIFSGGYAAGYYSYLFSEVMADDAFSRFEEQGVLNQTVGLALKNTILSQGGTAPALQLFEAFRGRSPKIEALLKHKGIQV